MKRKENGNIQNSRVSDSISSSIAMNLAEGNAKLSVKDKKRFYQISLGSLRECQTIFKLVKIQDSRLDDLSDHIGASLYKLIRN